MEQNSVIFGDLCKGEKYTIYIFPLQKSAKFNFKFVF